MNTKRNSHRECQHEPTKSARVHCRRQRAKFMMTDEQKSAGLYWTVGYISGKRVHRALLAMSWGDASRLASKIADHNPGMHVVYVTNLVWDCDNPYHEDAGYFLADDGERLPYDDDADNFVNKYL